LEFKNVKIILKTTCSVSNEGGRGVRAAQALGSEEPVMVQPGLCTFDMLILWIKLNPSVKAQSLWDIMRVRAAVKALKNP